MDDDDDVGTLSDYLGLTVVCMAAWIAIVMATTEVVLLIIRWTT